MNDQELADAFKALSDPHRLRALRFIASGAPPGADCEDDVCACHVQEDLDLSQPATSYHLKVLRQAGLVEAEKRGRWVHYRVSDDAIEALGRRLEEIAGAADARAGAVT